MIAHFIVGLDNGYLQNKEKVAGMTSTSRAWEPPRVKLIIVINTKLSTESVGPKRSYQFGVGDSFYVMLSVGNLR
jgi:hypothetical protein